MDACVHPSRRGEDAAPQDEAWRYGDYLSLIGAAVFSAGAGGSAGVAPSFCACASGWAGCGAISPGRVPVVDGSAGAEGLVSAPGVDCKGCVACATCGSRTAITASDRPDNEIPAATITDASSRSFLKLRFLLSWNIAFTPDLFAGSTDVTRHRSREPANRGSSGRYSSSSPASPSSSANASIVPLLFQASAETGA